MYAIAIAYDLCWKLADTVPHSASSTLMVLESKHCHDSFAGITVHLDYPRHTSPMSSDTEVLESELTGYLH